MPVFKFRDLSTFPELIHGVSTSDYGNLSYKWAQGNQQSPADIRAGRIKFFNDLSIQEDQVVGTQVVGGTDIFSVTAKNRGQGMTNPEKGLVGDGFVTGEKDTFLFILTGDCLALFFFEPVKKVCAIAHSGWKGVDNQMPGQMVRYLIEKHGCDPLQIRVGLSPALGKESATFENFEKFNQENLAAWQPYIDKKDDLYQVDWQQYAVDQLIKGGVALNHIESALIDTRTDARFYSHRRSKQNELPEARFGCLIGIKS